MQQQKCSNSMSTSSHSRHSWWWLVEMHFFFPFLEHKQNWYPQTESTQKVPHTMYCRIKFSPNVTNAITFAESHKSSSGKQLKKGGSNVVLCVYPAVPGFWYSAKHGSLKAKNSHTSQKMQRGKAMRCRSDIDSFRCKDSWWGGCHQYRCLFVVAILSCCQSLSPGVLLWFEWIMRRRSEWTIFSSTW